MDIPTRDEIIRDTAQQIYGGGTLNNAHRGDIVETIVLSALGDQWRLVGLGWHPWDLQRGEAADRVRIQVKQTAALQLWGPTKSASLSFSWSENPPDYFFKYNPGEEIEDEGWFCELFVFGIHDNADRETADQADPAQWQFLVVPICDLKRGQKTMVLGKALKTWQSVEWEQLPRAVEHALQKLSSI